MYTIVPRRMAQADVSDAIGAFGEASEPRAVAWVCGPTAFMASAGGWLASAGVTDIFTSRSTFSGKTLERRLELSRTCVAQSQAFPIEIAKVSGTGSGKR